MTVSYGVVAAGVFVVLAALLLPFLPCLMRVGMGAFGLGLIGNVVLGVRAIGGTVWAGFVVLQWAGTVLMLIAVGIHLRQLIRLRRGSSSL